MRRTFRPSILSRRWTSASIENASRISARRRYTEAASDPSSKVQFYLSRSQDPYLNLSIEHHLLQKTHPDSVVLFLYTNQPCIVIGRNQNPWLEVNLPLVEKLPSQAQTQDSSEGSFSDGARGGNDGPLDVQLVRRRSGGGTVFHDLGNVNYSVICPPPAFDRDKHAEMVVRALRKLGVDGARVNSRHDIVVDVDVDVDVDPDRQSRDAEKQTFKISGSAYKLTRLRSLHHGTCLLSSPNLGRISSLLRSPAEPFIKARGVESVRSRVANVGVGNGEFEDGVRKEFEKMYGMFDMDVVVDEKSAEIDQVKKGMAELKTRGWIYGQTPRFSFSTVPTEDDPRKRPALPFDTQLQFEAKQGTIQEFAINGKPLVTTNNDKSLEKALLYDVHSWSEFLQQSGLREADCRKMGGWLESLLGAGLKPVVS